MQYIFGSCSLELMHLPQKPAQPCRQPGCPALVQGGGYCEQHKRQEQRRYDEQRGSSTKRGYGARWRRAREVYLQNNPLCVMCEAEGELTPATVVDHRIPHKGNYELFWDVSNWQSLCKQCHDRKTVKEDGGFGKATQGGN